MAIHSLSRGQLSRPAPQSIQVQRFPAPMGGMDARVTLSREDLNFCIYTYNLLPTEADMVVRNGYREWQIDATVDPGVSVGFHTLVPFDGVEEAGAEDRLFGVTNEGIWDVTDAGGTPDLKLTFADQSETAGYGVYTHYVGNAGTDILFYADSKNGLFSYDYLTDTWSQATGITGPEATDIKFVALHKQRLWLIEENSTTAWYLPIGAISGAATEFFLGSKFRHGGNLEGVFSWSVDGGAGVDDYFVAVSRAGDVAVYQGADPSTAETWEQRGVYYIGDLPVGPSFGTEHGGELYLLSSQGVISMNDLLQGTDLATAGSSTDAGRISGNIRARMKRTRLDYGWAIRVIPSGGGMFVSTPIDASRRSIQYYFNLDLHAWGLVRDLDMSAFSSWQGSLVFGDPDGRVLYLDQTTDNVRLAPPVGEINGDPIEFSILTSFTTFDAEGLFKRVTLARPDFVAAAKPSASTQVRYDYRQDESDAPVVPQPLRFGIWDEGLWDSAVWGAGIGVQTFNSIGGTWGIGRHMALATKGTTSTRTSLVGWDVMYTSGGSML